MNQRSLAGAALMLMVASGVPAQEPETWMYKPSENVLERMTVVQARKAIENVSNIWLASTRRYVRVSVGDDHVEIQPVNSPGPAVSLYYKDLSRIELVRDSALIVGEYYGVLLGDKEVLWVQDGSSKEEIHKRTVVVADAFYVLKNYPPVAQRREEEEFQRAVQWFREQNPRPQFPEDARRYRVQAESAVRDKRFSDAAQRYAEALKVAPWWPEGHFNRALVLAEANRHEGAIREMKRYLMLVPDAPNARAAQDKIYEWEDRAGQKP